MKNRVKGERLKAEGKRRKANGQRLKAKGIKGKGKDKGRILNVKYCAGNIGDGKIMDKGKRSKGKG